MTKQEILHTSIGEMLDMLACHSIIEGGAKVKQPKLKMESFLSWK